MAVENFNAFNNTCPLIEMNLAWMFYGGIMTWKNSKRVKKQGNERNIAPYGLVTPHPYGKRGKILKEI